MLEKRNRDQGRRGQKYRDLGMYTAIPTMMIVGPALGYYLGHLAENKWGYSPWLSAGGAIFGLAASVRQIQLILQRHGSKSSKK